MPRKELQLLWRDIRFMLTGDADVAEADWRGDARLYPLDWGYQLDRPEDYFSPQDETGLPMRELPAGLGTVYLPSRIAGFACGNWNRFCETGEAHYRDGFMLAADWFARQERGAFYQSFDLIGIKAPWLTCINQGEGVSVLVRAARETGEAHYREQAVRAAEWLDLPMADGGLKDHLPGGKPFLEEYPGTIYRHVLNGCLYALVGLWDLVDAGLDTDGRYARLLNDVADGIEADLAAWQVGDWTTYSYRGYEQDATTPANPNTMTYQALQSILMGFLGAKLDRPILADAGRRWRRAQYSLLRRTGALAGKIRYRLSHGYHV